MKRNESVIQLLSDLVAIDSQSHKGNLQLIDFLSSLFKKYPQAIQSWVRDADGVKGKNLIVKIPGKSAEHALVFVGHTDTVPTSSAWETDPFILEESGGNLYGLGTCDTKGGIASLIEAVLALEEKPAYDTYLVFDGDEEVYSTGAHLFAKKLSLKNPHFIFLEPTDGEIHIAQRAILKFDVTTHGVSTHASLGTPQRNKKENAINKMMEVIQFLDSDAKELANKKHDYLASSTQNFGIINGGTARNVFADKVMLTVDRRLIPSINPKLDFERVKKLLTSRIGGVSLELDDIGEGFSMPENDFVKQILSSCKSIISSIKLGAFQAWSEAGIFAGKGDVVILGPGSLINEAHRANEFVEAHELFAFVHIFQKIMTEIQL